jgi:DNA helicase-2/ATP-dependent DNA helicase PcrA
VARVYTFYQQYLEREGLLDFGDLIFRSVRLFQECPDVRERVRRAYPQVLVDEFQDVNRASGILLRELAGDGSGLWAVGDARQAIYRFRGAAPANMRLFTEDYPNAAVMPLEVNYRSQPAVIETFAGLAPGMRATRGADFTPWRANRPEEGGRIYMEIAEDDAAEGEGLSGLIMDHHAEGIPFGEQAVLCRSHTTLARIGAMLERHGVPVLYLGDLFERPEVRDLLSFLELSRGDPGSLLRVARFPEYSVPMADTLAAIKRAKAEGHTIVETIAGAAGMEELSERGRAGLSLLATHLEEARGDEAWKVLTRYLFGVGGYLPGLLADRSVEGQQRRLALFQTLQFAHEQRRREVPEGEDRVRHFLDYVRRLELFGEERGLRQVPGWAEGVDAVRLLTIHASKGLEFRAVYVPVLGNGYFPARKQHESCPPPAGMLPAGEEDWHEEEEECLFFVALSRARDALCLSRARRYGRRPSNPSRLLALVADRLPRPPDSPPTWTSALGEVAAVEPQTRAPHIKVRFSSTVLETYIECPRRFYYDYMLGLGSEGGEGAYVRFHRSVYRAINYVHDESEAGREVVLDGALARLDEIWVEEEMPGQTHEELYRSQAREMLRRVVEGGARAGGPRMRPKWEVPLTYGRVAFTPDGAELIEEGGRAVRLQRLRTGRVSSREKDQPVYALYHKAASIEYPGVEKQVQALYLATGEAVDVVLTERQIETGLARYDSALAGILAGDFHPEPSDRRCPRCPHYFTCPAAEDGE